MARTSLLFFSLSCCLVHTSKMYACIASFYTQHTPDSDLRTHFFSFICRVRVHCMPRGHGMENSFLFIRQNIFSWILEKQPFHAYHTKLWGIVSKSISSCFSLVLVFPYFSTRFLYLLPTRRQHIMVVAASLWRHVVSSSPSPVAAADVR